MASLSEGLFRLYNCSFDSFNPRFTISLYTCWPSSNGNHMPSSARDLKRKVIENSRVSKSLFMLYILSKQTQVKKYL
jgi:hypothetical protein